MNTNKKDSFNKASVIISLSIILGTYVYAWTPAPANPPANNVPAPINVGTVAQTKAGGLGLGTDILPGEMFRVLGSGTFTGTISSAKVQLNDSVSEGANCTSVGLVARDSIGLLLSCQGSASPFTWKKASSSSSGTLITGGTCAVGQVVKSISTAGVVTCGVAEPISGDIVGGCGMGMGGFFCWGNMIAPNMYGCPVGSGPVDLRSMGFGFTNFICIQGASNVPTGDVGTGGFNI